MKVCITSEGNSLDSKLDPRFGRATYFLFVDTETMDVEAVFNENASGSGGVGVKSGQLMAEKGVEYVITGRVGPNASRTLDAGGIKVYTTSESHVKKALDSFIAS